MRSFLLGQPVDGAFNIPFKVERGESMETVTYNGDADITNGLQLKNWVNTLGYTSVALVNISLVSYDSPVAIMTSVQGVASGYFARNRSRSISSGSFVETTTCTVPVGTKFAVIPCNG